MRLLICAGGTGGGVYPALAVHSALTVKVLDLDTLWVGGEGGIEEALVKGQGITFKGIPAAGLHGVGLAKIPRNLVTLTRGVFAARKILKEFQPDVLFFTGGYVAVPMAMAGRSIPSLLYVPDIEPGMALKSLAGFSDAIAVTTEQSRRFFNKKVWRRVTRSARTSRFGAAAQTTPLTVSAVTVMGDYVQTNECLRTLAPGASCEVKVRFKPTAVGARLGELAVASNAAGSPHAVKLSGTGTQKGSGDDDECDDDEASCSSPMLPFGRRRH